jgi:hypothetical protein
MTSKPRNPKRRRPIGKRDYGAEYARRVALAESRGLSRSVGRGHARAGERIRPPGVRLINPYLPEERAIKRMAHGESLRAAAKAVGVTEERLRRHLKENTDAKPVGRRWEISDQRPRQYPFYSAGRLVSPWLSLEEASKAAHYMQAVQRYLPRGDPALLEPFVDDGVVDIYGHRHPFETDEDTILQLDQAGELNFPEIYKIIAEA